jgi:hypothetical protein
LWPSGLPHGAWRQAALAADQPSADDYLLEANSVEKLGNVRGNYAILKIDLSDRSRIDDLTCGKGCAPLKTSSTTKAQSFSTELAAKRRSQNLIDGL